MVMHEQDIHSAKVDAMSLDTGTLLEMQRRMLRIRHFDERASKMVKRGLIPGTVHTSIGQEAQVVGACMALRDGDYMSGNHRSHGHPIGKGSPLGPLMAELVGKSGGVCGGKGGSLHLADFAVGSLGESGIVGSSIPIATGAALSAKLLGNGRVALAFFGDGAANQGCLYEAMNLAGSWDLPVIFLCENNQYALSTPAHTVMSTPHSTAGNCKSCKKKKGKATKARPCVVKEQIEVNTDRLNKGRRIKSTGNMGAACPRCRKR